MYILDNTVHYTCNISASYTLRFFLFFFFSLAPAQAEIWILLLSNLADSQRLSSFYFGLYGNVTAET
jgi:hypothetical protein